MIDVSPGSVISCFDYFFLLLSYNMFPRFLI